MTTGVVGGRERAGRERGESGVRAGRDGGEWVERWGRVRRFSEGFWRVF